MVSRIFNRLWWQVGSSCVINGENFREFRTSGTPGDKSAGPWNTPEEKIETPSTSMVNIAILTCCVGLFIPRTSSVSTEQSRSGVDRIPEKRAKEGSKVLARHHQTFK